MCWLTFQVSIRLPPATARHCSRGCTHVPRKVRAQSLLSSLKPRVLAGDQTGSGGGQLPATRTASADDSFGIGTGVF